jgi:DinB superfamily
MDEKVLRDYLRRALDSREAHVALNKAIGDVPANLRGVRPSGAPHSLWELLEHMRIATGDILEFCRNPKHKSPAWPEGYWPANPIPPSAAAWGASVQSLERDLIAMGKLAANPKTDLLAKIPGGSGQTVLREILLIGDHNAYHLGQFVLVRRLLGCWLET